ncbi:uncharacterized protein PAC_08504 [Phialocephala subalpina]|uniref:non-specific serine/threonine protein kinase n=1 Tax=Phialocephala subalpina TaxID=576137 RepID=A0A1L7X0R6_9HELO|nr:uncharacterized protein PAC_08504 [Phialocephala subalpina]
MPSEIEHWHIDATVYKDRVEEVHYVSDPAQNIRRKPRTITWQVERFLGRGTFGEVRLERNKADGSVRAVKRIATTNPSLKNSECERELKALLEFSKPKSREAAVFVDFLGWFKDQSDVFLAMEFIPLGDLETNIRNARSGRLPEIEAQEITEQILSGLEIMHTESFAHRDLKPQNILVVHGPPQWWIKIADFGLSKRLTESRVPFPLGPTLGEFCRDTSLLSYEALGDSGISRNCSGLIKKLLVPEPSKRLSASEALQHHWNVEGLTELHTATIYISKATILVNETPPISYQRTLTPSGLSESMSQLRFDTASHAGLHSYRFSRSAEGKLEAPRNYESDEDLPRKASLKTSEEAAARLAQRKADLRMVEDEEREQVDKASEDESQERLYDDKKLRDKERRDRRGEHRTRQAYVEDESSDPETYPGLRTAAYKAQRKLEKEIVAREEQASAMRAEEARTAKVQAQQAQIKEDPLDPIWRDHMDFAGAYMQAVRRKHAVEADDDRQPHPGLRRAETFSAQPPPQYNVRYATAPDYSDDDTPRRSSARDRKEGKRRRRLHVDKSDETMTDAPPVLPTGLSDLKRLMSPEISSPKKSKSPSTPPSSKTEKPKKKSTRRWTFGPLFGTSNR